MHRDWALPLELGMMWSASRLEFVGGALRKGANAPYKFYKSNTSSPAFARDTQIIMALAFSCSASTMSR